MKRTIYRLFEDQRRAEGTVRELALMQIPVEDLSLAQLRGQERRSFMSADAAWDDTRPAGSVVCARVDLEDVARVEATLVRNGGQAFQFRRDPTALALSGQRLQ